MASVVSLEDVSKWLGDKLVLGGVNWSVSEGEHWVVLGANGSGKTTMLRIASGYLWPTSGTVSVLGRRFGSVDLRELRKKIGWVTSALTSRIPPGEQALNVVLSGRYASMGLYDEPSEADRGKAAGILEFMDCGELACRCFGVLSQGEQQRVLIARALMSDPRLLILDEPSAGLDLKAREGFLESVAKLTEEHTVAYVTHHIEEIIPEFTHVILLKDGRVLRSGVKEDVLSTGNLREAFGVGLEVDFKGGRYSVRL